LDDDKNELVDSKDESLETNDWFISFTDDKLDEISPISDCLRDN